MTEKTLYIIGNGFDIHHGQKSRYSDFKTFLETRDKDLLERLEQYFGTDSLWWNFEETLAYLDTEDIVDECLNYLTSYSSDDWRDSDNHTYQYEVQQRINLITDTLKVRFTEWILQLKLPQEAVEKKLQIKEKSTFINFNYTDVLESLYKIPRNQIFYIHNKAEDIDSTLILGHSRTPQKNSQKKQFDEDSDVRIMEGDRILDSYYEETYKSTKKIIKANKAFFQSLSKIKAVYILGHSLSEVDIKYFKEIIKNIDLSKVRWYVSVYNKKELVHHSEVLKKLGVPKKNIELDSISNLNSNQINLFST